MWPLSNVHSKNAILSLTWGPYHTQEQANLGHKPSSHCTMLDKAMGPSHLSPPSDQPPVLAVLGSVLVPLLCAFSGTGLQTCFVPSDLFRTSGCHIGPIPTCPLFSHFRSPSGTIPVGTTYTTTKPSDIDTLAHLKLPSTPSPLQT